MRHKILEVEWIDSQSRGRWRDIEEAAKDYAGKCCTVGLVIRDDGDSLVLAQTWSDDLTCVCDTMSIPRKSILRRKNIGTVKPKR